MKTKLIIAAALVALLILMVALLPSIQSIQSPHRSSTASRAPRTVAAPPVEPVERGKVTLENPPAPVSVPSPPVGASEEPVKTGDYPLGKPLANKKVEGLVPPELVEKIAANRTAERWGKAALGPPLECCDENGDIIAYMWPAALKADTFPAYSAILDSVKEGRTMMETGMAGGRPASNAEESGRARSIGEGDFGFVIVSARYDQFPVPGYMHYLPRYYYNGDLAAQAAANALSAKNVTLDRIYFLDGGHEQYFGFVWANQRVLVHADSLDVRKPEEVLKRGGVKQAMDPQDAADLAKEWAEITKEVQ